MKKFIKRDTKAIMSKMVKAIPPDNYLGSISSWVEQLQARGLFDIQSGEYYADIMIKEKEWFELIKICERQD